MAVGAGSVESLDLNSRLLGADLAGKRVFVTGHTGFKGSWMTALLKRLGCDVYGYALSPKGEPNLFELASLRELLAGETIADIRDSSQLAESLRIAQPALVIHMAAQAFVRRSYAEPVDTWGVNVMGTVNLLEAARSVPGILGVVVVTTDKCYENRGWEWGYRENDSLGGHDPYSASKAAAELVTAAHGIDRQLAVHGVQLTAPAVEALDAVDLRQQIEPAQVPRHRQQVGRVAGRHCPQGGLGIVHRPRHAPRELQRRHHRRIEQRFEDGFLVGEVVVQRGLTDADGLGDGPGRGHREALRHEQFSGGIEDLLDGGAAGA